MNLLEQSTSRLSLAVEKLAKIADNLENRHVQTTGQTNSLLQEKITQLSNEKNALDKELSTCRENNVDAQQQLERAIARLETILK